MRLLFGLLLPLCATIAAPAHAREIVVYEEVIEEWLETGIVGAERFVAASGEALEAPAAYGPFRVLDEHRAALTGITDSTSPAAFAAMLRDHPRLAVLEMIDCPGTFDDIANLELGRMIRRAGLATHVPPDGSVRSGAVELFLAGATRQIDDGAEFAVHAWEDEDGHEATDFAADAPQNRKYLAYYREMGMDDGHAAAFYEMTNSVPFDRARWLSAEEMRRWLPEAHQETDQDLAYLDSGAALH